MPRKSTKTKVKPAIKLEDAEIANPTKYDIKPKIGEPKLGVEKDFVTRVGLGNLKVIDNGRKTYEP
tara:strand:+ start:331 stop:528 length:198 start_codon:yes stop_codon:yes gene_type:complete